MNFLQYKNINNYKKICNYQNKNMFDVFKQF